MQPGPASTPQLKKLGLAPGARWRLYGEPSGWAFEVPPDPADEVEEGEPADVIVVFVSRADEVGPALARLENAIFPAGALWIAWPRRSAGHLSDITDNTVRDAALARSLVDTKVAAIDADWSGLKLVWRLSSRSAPPGS